MASSAAPGRLTKMGGFYVGISGWRYKPWRGAFYPEDLPQRQELEFASRLFNTIEINGSFYSLQRPEYYRNWRDAAPRNFLFSVKAPRYITHILRLKDIEEPLANFFASGVLLLEDKLGPILWQFPESFPFKPDRFETLFHMLPQTTESALKLCRKRGTRMTGRASATRRTKGRIRHAVEVRNKSFVSHEFFQMLRRFGIAAVVADTTGKWPLIEEATANFIYARLHGDKELYAGGYSERALDNWSQKFKRWARAGKKSGKESKDVFVYFDNDVKVYAPFDAHRLSLKFGISNDEWEKSGLGLAPLGKSRRRS